VTVKVIAADLISGNSSIEISDPATFDKEQQTVSVSYDNATANAENRDAFYAAELALAVNGPVNKTITLTRPFAQVNIGTSDLVEAGAAGLNVTETRVSVKAYGTLDLATGDVDGEQDVEFALAAIPTAEDGAFPVAGYDYLAMNYILVPADKQLVDVEFDTNAGGSASTFAGVPVQRNYRTNIYGALLTNPAEFNVVIDQEYAQPDFEYPAAGVVLDEATKTYTVTAPQGLQWLSDESKGKEYAFRGYTIKLGNDIDMAGQEFTPIAKGAFFSGTFDGDGHTIANLTVNDPDCSGLVWSNRGVMKNITMTNVNITGNFKVGAIAGDGLCGTFDNCTVDGGTITSTPRLVNGKYDDGNNAGGITGYLSAEPNASLTNCTVKNVTITAYRVLGSIAGTVGGEKAAVSGNKAENCAIIANQLVKNYDGAPRAPEAEELFGRVLNGATIGEGNEAVNVTVKVIAADLISGNSSIEISDPATFEAVFTSLNSYSLANKTITLTADIDGTGLTVASKWYFEGSKNVTFDGGGHKISNLALNGGLIPSGFFSGLTVKDITFENCTVTQGPLG
ncbi:MAG: hypothetical protein K2G30_09150, partial [Muribaculaceae bacterium]|nr:hypothetical protein [Muribaculaceae bacterium]